MAMLRVATREGGESGKFNVVIPPKWIGQYPLGALHPGIVRVMPCHT
jgi:hypothetical protein